MDFLDKVLTERGFLIISYIRSLVERGLPKERVLELAYEYANNM